MKNLFEVYLTSEYVEKEEWLKLFIRLGKINKILHKKLLNFLVYLLALVNLLVAVSTYFLVLQTPDFF